MNHWKLLAAAMLALALAACGTEEDTGPADAAQESETAAADAGERERARDTSLAEPEEVMEEPNETSRELWDLIQEEHSELTDEQQRALQACAEIRLRDQDIAMEDAVEECRGEMEEMAEEQEEEEDAGSE